MITRYEVTAQHPDGRTYLVGYTPRQSRPGLLSAMQNVGDELIAVLPVEESDELTFGKEYDRWICTVSNWTVGFTGRTQIDARNSREHTFIKTVSPT